MTIERALLRRTTRVRALDRLLGGGLVAGSVVLLRGEPGAGKSTLLLQALAADDRVLYVAGDELAAQVLRRARRVSAVVTLSVVEEVRLERVLEQARTRVPTVLVVDPVERMRSLRLHSRAGSASHLRECVEQLAQFASVLDTTVVLTDYMKPGRRTLGHVVDAELRLETSRDGDARRVLRVHKNRFGPDQAVATLRMEDVGLTEDGSLTSSTRRPEVTRRSDEPSPG